MYRLLLVVLLGTIGLVGWLLFDAGSVYFSRLSNYPFKNEILQVEWYHPVQVVRGGGAPTSLNILGLDTKKLHSSSEAKIEALVKKVFSGPAHGMILFKDGITRVSQLSEKLNPFTPFNSMSMSKPLLSLLVGVLIGEGRISSVEDPIGLYMPELRSDERSKIKIRNLLEMNSGLKFNKSTTFPLSDQARIHLGDGVSDKIFSFALKQSPGLTYEYLNINTLLLVELVRRVTQKDFAVALSERIWSKLAVRDATLWVDDQDKFPKFYCCFFAAPLDWIEVAKLFLNDGKNSNQDSVVPAGWLGQMTQPSKTEPSYGLHIQVGLKHGFYFSGRGHQRLMIIPERKIIFLRIGETDKNWKDEEILELLNEI